MELRFFCKFQYSKTWEAKFCLITCHFLFTRHTIHLIPWYLTPENKHTSYPCSKISTYLKISIHGSENKHICYLLGKYSSSPRAGCWTAISHDSIETDVSAVTKYSNVLYFGPNKYIFFLQLWISIFFLNGTFEKSSCACIIEQNVVMTVTSWLNDY